MAPLLFSLLLFLSSLSFSLDILPRAEFVLGNKVPDVQLVTHRGEITTLSALASGKPTLLTFIYTKCTSSCPIIFQNLSETLKKLPYTDYKVVLIDFDERDNLSDLKRFAQQRLPANGRWVVALAKGDNLRALTSSLDFRFTYDEKTDMFAHPNILAVLSPDLKLSGYILGLSFSSSKLLELVSKAREGKVDMNPIKGLILKCFRYDPVTGAYTIDWSFVAMIVGGLIPISLMIYFLVLKDFLMGLRRSV